MRKFNHHTSLLGTEIGTLRPRLNKCIRETEQRAKRTGSRFTVEYIARGDRVYEIKKKIREE